MSFMHLIKDIIHLNKCTKHDQEEKYPYNGCADPCCGKCCAIKTIEFKMRSDLFKMEFDRKERYIKRRENRWLEISVRENL